MDDQITAERKLMMKEVKEGLRKSSKQLPSKFFYDERGSELFEQITHLDEYYLTRCEKAIMKENISEISKHIGSNAMLVELGSGSSKKTRLLLDQVSDLTAYVPVDISEEYLLKIVSRLRIDYPQIPVIPIFSDYTSDFNLPNLGGDYNSHVVFFPGSTIGNFNPAEIHTFWDNITSVTDNDSGMLIGVDLKKDKQILEAAYNDSQGITAQFNKNILVRMNREINADFDIDQFTHRAFYNEDEGRIEMHLISQTEQEIEIAGDRFHFEKGESIHTENSYKYSLKEFEKLVSDWYSVEKVWTDDRQYFSLQFLAKK